MAFAVSELVVVRPPQCRVWLKKAGPDERISDLMALCEGDEFFTT